MRRREFITLSLAARYALPTIYPHRVTTRGMLIHGHPRVSKITAGRDRVSACGQTRDTNSDSCDAGGCRSSGTPKASSRQRERASKGQ